jgi:hypothetical protein
MDFGIKACCTADYVADYSSVLAEDSEASMFSRGKPVFLDACPLSFGIEEWTSEIIWTVGWAFPAEARGEGRR